MSRLMHSVRPRVIRLRPPWGGCVQFLLGLLLAFTPGLPGHTQTSTPGSYQAYPLRYKSAADVEKVLGEMLAGQQVAVHVVADSRANQILVRGPAEAQQLVWQLIQSTDQPPPPAVPERLVIRIYRCQRDRLEAMASRLRDQYAGQSGVRVAADLPTSQLLVLAPPQVQEAIARQVAEPPVAGTAGTGPSHAPTAAVAHERFVSLTHARVEQIEQTLRQLLGPRLQGAPQRQFARTDYMFVDAGGARVDIACDHQRNGVAMVGNPSLVEQFVRLVRSLDTPAQPAGAKMRVLPVRRADLEQVKSVVEAYRSGTQGEGAGQKAQQSPAPQAAAPPPDQSGRRNDQGAIQRGSHLFQVAPEITPTPPPSAAVPGAEPPPTAFPPGQAPPAGEEERMAEPQLPAELTRPGEQVEIETLPDLDVIILRGPERDVEEVTRIIEELERLSAETTPAIEIYQLRHVQGQALAMILTQVNTELIGGRPGRVSVTPLGKPNALLLIGWGEAVKALKELISRLDQPVPPDTQFKVLPLKHAPALLTGTTIMQMYRSRGGLAPMVNVIPDMRTNALIVQASPRDMAELEALVQKLDVDQTESVTQAQVFKLDNSLALDVASTLQRAIMAARGGAQGQKSSALELLDLDAQGKQLIRSGILSDVEITPDPRTNTVIVSAPAESMELVAALVKQLDSPSAVAQIKVFRIVNGDANSMVLVLRGLFPTQVAGIPGPQLPGAEGESTLVPLRFSVDLRTNAIIATGSAGDLLIVEALLLRLDAEDVQTRENEVYRLKNAPALDVATAINEFLRSRRQVQLSAPGTTSPFEQIESEVVVVPEPVSNALIISATPRFFEDILQLVEKLDEQPPQVVIQVLIAQVDLSDTSEFGIEMGLQDSVLFDRSILGELLTVTRTVQQPGLPQVTQQEVISASNTPGFNFNSTGPLGNSGSNNALTSASIVGTQGLSNLALGRMNSELGFGGLVVSAGSEAVSVLLRALQQCKRIEVLSRPQVMTLDNQPAYIQVGKRVPRIVGSAVTNQGLVNDITLENVGLILGVTPRISPDGRVVMEIDAEKSELGSLLEGIPVAVAEGQEIRSPTISVTMAQTTVSAGDGETIVLGGLITENDETIRRRVPWLAEIPVLGHLFRYDYHETGRSELLIVLTPHVVRTPEQAEKIKKLEAARMHWCLADVNQLQGETGLFDARTDAVGDSTKVVYPQAEPEVIPPGEQMPREMLEDRQPPPAMEGAAPTLNPARSSPGSEADNLRFGFRQRPVQRRITADSIPKDAFQTLREPDSASEDAGQAAARAANPLRDAEEAVEQSPF